MRRLPSLTPAQRRALLVIEWVLLIGLIVVSFWKWQSPSNSSIKEEKQRKWSNLPVKPFRYAEDEPAVESFVFDPNTADSTMLLRLGLSRWQVKGIYRYRAKHGRYHTPEDFMRVPNLTNEQWERLKPYIRIAPQFQYVQPAPRRAYQREDREETIISYNAEPQDTARKERTKTKITFGQTVDINTADTTLLKMIPGIASKRAARIVAYRKALGGFVAVEQAMEATEMPDSVLKYMTVSPVEVQKISVNKLSVQQLMKHPYLNFYQAKAIFEHRRNKGELHTFEEMSRLEGFRQTDIDRLRPYIEF